MLDMFVIFYNLFFGYQPFQSLQENKIKTKRSRI